MSRGHATHQRQSLRTRGVLVSALLPLVSVRVTACLLQDKSLCCLENSVPARGQCGSHTNHSLQICPQVPRPPDTSQGSW